MSDSATEIRDYASPEEVAEQMARRFGPWPEAERVRTDLAPEDSTRSALLAFG